MEENGFNKIGMVGLDVKALRTQPADRATRHLSNSLSVFLRLVEIVRSLDRAQMAACIEARDYEALDWLVLDSLLG